MSLIAAIRPDEWELPLFIHVLSALTLTAALVLTVTYLFSAWRSDDAGALRLGFRTLLFGVLPSYIVLRGSSEWLLEKENLRDADLAWIDIGYMATDMGFLFLLVGTILAWLGSRKGSVGGGPKVAAVLIALFLVLNLVALWAMTTKPV